MKKRMISKRVEVKHTIDYSKLGLKVGIEIHQRLGTEHKLFCECSPKQENEPTGQVIRRLRAVAGEVGGIDQAALYEYMRSKSFIYKTSPNETCLVDLDSEPPHELNNESLIIALQLCKLLDCDVPEELHVMRKTVIDGSNTGGFQRTTILGTNGSLKMPFGTVPISQVCLEEEAGRIDQKSEGEVTYRLSGLGIPLVEITTGIIDDAQRAFETAKALGLLLRSLRVQRGIGTIRQDINISIAGGARVEIKGFQELEDIPKLIENEVKRQGDLLEIRKLLIQRKSHSKPIILDVTDVFKATKNDLIRRFVMDGAHVFALLLPEFGGLLKHECGDRTLGAELAGYARAYGLGGMIHTDEDLAKYKLAEEFIQIRKLFAEHSKQAVRKAHAETQDAIIIFAGKLPAVENAARAVLERATHCEENIPEETRVADGTGSKYARPLPGRARMYPETDIPPISISKEMLDAVAVPETLAEKSKDLAKVLPKDLAQQILISYYFPLYERLAAEFDPVLVARTFAYTLKEVKRKSFDVDKLTEDDFHSIFLLIEQGEIPADSISDIIIARLEGKTFEDIKNKFAVMPDAALRRYIREIVEKNKGKNEQVLMGIVMQSVRGRARGEIVVRILREEIDNAKLGKL
jgi:glutamyl-tRNA(Gln) amidotransferase subunit E